MSLNFKRRLAGLQQQMENHHIDLVVCGSCQNFQYLTGLLTDWRRGIDLGTAMNNVFVPKKGEPILTFGKDFADQPAETWIKDIRIEEEESYSKSISKIFSDLDLTRGAHVGIGDHVWGSTIVTLAKEVGDAKFVKAEALMDDLRMIKDEGEIEKLRRAASLTDGVVETIVSKIVDGVTQQELVLEVESKGKLLGASDVSFPPTVGFVKSGSEVSPDPFTYPKEKGLVSGTSIAFDIGFVVDGYCSDFGRSFYFGQASAEFKKGYEALQLAVAETVDKMYDGSMRVCELFPALEKTLDKKGYGDYLRARLPNKNLGHNIGVEVHEPPWLSPRYSEKLQENMVVALEPKLWHAGEYYLRVEDMVLVGSSESEFLTNFDRELFEL